MVDTPQTAGMRGVPKVVAKSNLVALFPPRHLYTSSFHLSSVATITVRRCALSHRCCIPLDSYWAKYVLHEVVGRSILEARRVSATSWAWKPNMGLRDLSSPFEQAVTQGKGTNVSLLQGKLLSNPIQHGTGGPVVPVLNRVGLLNSRDFFGAQLTYYVQTWGCINEQSRQKIEIYHSIELRVACLCNSKDIGGMHHLHWKAG